MEAMINMRYAGIIKNDLAGGEGVCVSLFTQGCPFHCDKCHNPQTWDPNGGELFTDATVNEILTAIGANGINRNFNIMGGEPLIEQNRKDLNVMVAAYERISGVELYKTEFEKTPKRSIKRFLYK